MGNASTTFRKYPDRLQPGVIGCVSPELLVALTSSFVSPACLGVHESRHRERVPKGVSIS